MQAQRKSIVSAATLSIAFGLAVGTVGHLSHNAANAAIGGKCADLFETNKTKPLTKDSKRVSAWENRSFHSPTSEAEFSQIVKNTSGPISVLGGGFSMGGQVASRGGVTIDMSKYNSILNVDAKEKTVTVQAGATWRQVQEAIVRHGLAVKVMQTYNNFQVGGSLSVNVHGRYVGLGAIISTVREIRVLLADGQIVTASRNENSELFFGTIGGYGGLGVILQAKLDLADNVKVERKWQEFSNKEGSIGKAAGDYVRHFRKEIAENPDAVFTNADIYPPNYELIRSISYVKTDKPLTTHEHLQPAELSRFATLLNSTLASIEQLFSAVKRYRSRVYELQALKNEKVVMRNWEASFDVDELSPLNVRFPILKKIFGFSNRQSYLQEYFIPADKLESFLPKMKAVFQQNDVNVTNVSIRHVPKNNESMLSWSNKESFALVIYYAQRSDANSQAHARIWTQQMLNKVLDEGGSYYLPYQLYARVDQFRQAYPGFGRYVAAKGKFDPNNKFSNYFLDTYVKARDSFHYREMLESDMAQIDMMDFFRNVFGIIKPANHMAAIKQAYAELKTEGIPQNDRNMYERIQKLLPKLAGNPLAKAARAVNSLRTQQNEMAGQTAELLADSGKTQFDGYVEIGTPGRYVGYLKNRLKIGGSVYVVNETKPKLLSPEDLLERTGGFGVVDPRSYTSAVLRNKHVDLSDYDAIPQTSIPNASVDLASVFIGLHHAPPEKLRQFVASINRILRPGGRFVLRDHDVNSREMHRMANLAHSTFNAGLGVSYAAEVTDVRNFHAKEYWIQLLKESGLELATPNHILQKGDPSLNTLMVFKKVSEPKDKFFDENAIADSRGVGRENLKSLNGYFRSGTHTYMVAPEWFWVDVYAEYAAFQARKPWYLFPFKEYMSLSKKVYEAHRDYAKRQGIDDKVAFEEYDKMDKALIASNGVLFWGLEQVAKFTKWSLRKETPPSRTGFVVQGIDDAQLAEFSTGLITEVAELRDGLTMLATERQMPFTKAMIELAEKENVKLLEVAGNTDISVIFAAKGEKLPAYAANIKTVDSIISYAYPTEISSFGQNVHLHSVKVHVSELGLLLRKIKEAHDQVMRVHDF